MGFIRQRIKPEGCLIITLFIPFLISDCCHTIGLGGFAYHRFSLIGQFARWDAQKRIDDLLRCILQPIPDYTILYYELSGFQDTETFFSVKMGSSFDMDNFMKLLHKKCPEMQYKTLTESTLDTKKLNKEVYEWVNRYGSLTPPFTMIVHGNEMYLYSYKDRIFCFCWFSPVGTSATGEIVPSIIEECP